MSPRSGESRMTENRIAFAKQARTNIRKTSDGWQLEIHFAGQIDVESMLKE